ncbi:MAG: RhuM family protein [Bacteroidota bacterium]|nr:RhuM family protein [Bacteroidota bacterium]
MKNEIILYQSNELTSRIEVRIEDETVWLTQEQMASLFGRNRVAITQHIGNVFKEGELDKEVVCKDFLLTTQHGAVKGKTQTRKIKIYNLDVIISVGYRVKSKQGTQFRIWANQILKDYLLKGYSLNNRMNRIEDNLQNLSKKVNGIDLQINASLPPNQDIFFKGQIFDAYTFVSDLVRTARSSIILIDNYIDDTVLTHFAKREKDVSFTILTKNISKQLSLDIKKHNEQYPTVTAKAFKDAHDRFLIIDETEIYHFGASLKDLGKKWFAFSKMDISSVKVLDKLKEEGLI